MNERVTLRAEFAGSRNATLAARLDLPSADARAYAVFAHCFTCSKDLQAASRIARGLSERGIGVLRFDFTGLGHSGGEFASTNFSSNVEDLVAACDWLRSEHGAPSLLVGHSLGGAAVLAGAASVPEVRAVATIGAPADPAHVAHLIASATEEIEVRGEARVAIGGREFTVRKQFLDDLTEQRHRERIRDLGRALLILHSPDDRTVPIEEAARIYGAARHPKSFVSLDGADHLLTAERDAVFVADLLAVWALRYVI
ncbi:MAG: alpha/beta fold hydrolase [Planctomycetota bacterium]